MRGINTTNLIAGRIELCVDSEWWALCHDGWGILMLGLYVEDWGSVSVS